MQQTPLVLLRDCLQENFMVVALKHLKMTEYLFISMAVRSMMKMKKIVEPGEFIVMVGASSDDKDLLKDSFFVK